MRELPLLKTSPAATLRVRGHTLLCLQGFRGLGYSPGFVENLATVHRNLAAAFDTLVQVVDAPDVVCGACPHETGSGCTLSGEGTEADMQAQDRVVLTRLGLQPGDRLPWGQVLERIRQSVSGDDLPTICGRCRWLSLGYCREGIEQLRSRP